MTAVTGGRGLPALVAAALAGCAAGTTQLEPAGPIPDPSPSGAPRLIVEEISVRAGATSFVVSGRLNGGRALRGAHLGSSSGPPCGGAGPEAAVIELDGQPRWERPLPLGAGDRRLALAFPSQTLAGPRDMSSGGFLDLELELEQSGKTTCLRTPFAGAVAAQPWRKRSPWSLGWSLWLYPSFQLGASVGRWTGPVRFGADLGLSTHACARCPRGAGYLLMPVSLTAESYLPSRLGPTLGLKLAYDGVPGVAVATHRRDALVLHGPRAELKVTAGMQDGGLVYGPRMSAFYLSGFVARWGTGDLGQGETFAGVAIGWDVGL